MNRNRHRLADYLGHILEAIERIERYTEDLGEDGFLADQMAQDAVIRNLEIIGEASHKIERHYPEFATAHPELPLAFAYQMRNAVRFTGPDCAACERPAWPFRWPARSSTVDRPLSCSNAADPARPVHGLHQCTQ